MSNGYYRTVNTEVLGNVELVLVEVIDGINTRISICDGCVLKNNFIEGENYCRPITGNELVDLFSDEEVCSKEEFEVLWNRFNSKDGSKEFDSDYSFALYEYIKKIHKKYLDFKDKSMVNELKFDNQFPSAILEILDSIKEVNPKFEVNPEFEDFFEEYEKYVDEE